jgi:hypothetical protein
MTASLLGVWSYTGPLLKRKFKDVRVKMCMGVRVRVRVRVREVGPHIDRRIERWTETGRNNVAVESRISFGMS